MDVPVRVLDGTDYVSMIEVVEAETGASLREKVCEAAGLSTSQEEVMITVDGAVLEPATSPREAGICTDSVIEVAFDHEKAKTRALFKSYCVSCTDVELAAAVSVPLAPLTCFLEQIRSSSGVPLLQAALSNRAYTVTKALLASEHAHFLVNVQHEQSGRTPLHIVAATAPDADAAWLVELLIQKGASAEVKDRSGATPLVSAVWAKNLGAARVLIHNKSPLGGPCGSPMHAATAVGVASMVNLLLDSGADINCQDQDQRTPLMTAVICNKPSMAELLLKRGCRRDLCDSQGKTALHFAACRTPAFLKTLLHWGCDPSVRDANSHTAVHYARRGSAAAEVLISHGADIGQAGLAHPPLGL